MEQLKHECGVAMIRLLKPLEYYEEKYGTWMYGLNKLYLLMEKQHNRGQEGAGLACVKLEASPGEEYMFRERALGSGAITEIFGTVQGHFKDLTKEQLHDADYAKRVLPFAGEVYMGHLRYSTTGKSGISYVHPFLRRNNWRAKNLALCGNFNMTNVDEIFARITAIGQHPRKYADTYIMLEQLGHRLDREVERLFNLAEAEGLAGMDIHRYIENNIDLPSLAPLIKIARALGVRLGTFLDDQEEQGAVICRKQESEDTISFSNNAMDLRTHMRYHSLSKSKADRHMEPFIVDVEPTEESHFSLSSHEGEEFIYVMEGAVEVCHGKKCHLIKAGDSIYYDSIVPHHVHGYQGQAAKILAVIYTPI